MSGMSVADDERGSEEIEVVEIDMHEIGLMRVFHFNEDSFGRMVDEHANEVSKTAEDILDEFVVGTRKVNLFNEKYDEVVRLGF